jgi:membrane protein
MSMRDLGQLLWDTGTEWRADKAGRLAAALAFYAMIALAPLSLLVVTVATGIIGQRASDDQVVQPIHFLVGPEAATALETVIAGVDAAQSGLTATFLSIATFLFGASHLFAELKSALNTIWNVRRTTEGSVGDWLRTRALAILAVMGASLILGIALGLQSTTLAVTRYLGIDPGGSVGQDLLGAGGVVLSFGVISVFSAALYKLLPDAMITWHDVWIGAIVTAGLLLAGQAVLGWYFRHSAVGVAFGTLGSFVVLLIWLFFSSQMVLFGAEFTWLYANRYGSRVVPAADAESVAPPDRPRP